MWEAIKSLIEAAAVRVKNPLSGAFALAWLLYNWDFWVYWFGKYPAPHKVAVIRREVMNWEGLLVPLGLACAYVFLMPRIVVLIAKFTSKPEIEALKESRDLRSALAGAKEDQNADKLAAQQKRIDENVGRLNGLEQSRENIEEQIKASEEKLRQLKLEEVQRKLLGTPKSIGDILCDLTGKDNPGEFASQFSHKNRLRRFVETTPAGSRVSESDGEEGAS